MITLNEGKMNEVTLRVVMESAENGRKFFDEPSSLEEMIVVVNRLINNSVKHWRVPAFVGIALIGKDEYGQEGSYGVGLERLLEDRPRD